MKTLSILFSCLILASCASIIDTQKVQMTIRTPGTDNAKCHIENKDYKYIAYTDQTIEVMKTPYDYVVHCMAPGNRDKTVIANRKINKWAFANVVNGFVPGAVYDVLSHGAFDYADEIIVSFSGEAEKCYPVPGYMNEDGCGVRSNDSEPFTLQKKQNLYAEPASNASVNKSSVSVTPAPKEIYDEKSAPPVVGRRKAYDLPAVSYDPFDEDK